MRSWSCVFACFLALLFAPFFVGCQKKKEPPPVIRIGHASHDHHAPLFIAAKNPEYFREHGGVYLREIEPRKSYDMMRDDEILARLELTASTGGGELVRKLNEDQFDLVFGGVPAMLQFIDEGNSLRILAPSNAEGSGLVLGPEIPARDWREFVAYLQSTDKPVRVGYKIAVSVQNLIFEHALRSENISYSSDFGDLSAKVHLINLSGAENLIPALKSGLIDGFVVNQPIVAKAEYEKTGRMIANLGELPPDGMWRGSPCCAVAGSERFIAARQEVMAPLVTLFLRANRFIQENPEKAAEQVASWLNQPVEVEKLSLPTSRYTYEFTDDWNRGVDFWVKAMIESGALKGRVKEDFERGELKALIYATPLYEKAKKNM